MNSFRSLPLLFVFNAVSTAQPYPAVFLSWSFDYPGAGIIINGTNYVLLMFLVFPGEVFAMTFSVLPYDSAIIRSQTRAGRIVSFFQEFILHEARPHRKERRTAMKEHIMMIHGMWGGGWVWENYKSFFEAKGFDCSTPTLRLHDRTSAEEFYDQLGTTSLLDYAGDLENDICTLDQKPVLMGHSMGGLLAQMLAGRGLAKALVLLTPASPRGIVALKPSVIRSFWSALTKPGFWRKPMKQTFEEAVYSMMKLLPPQEQREMYERFVPESGRAGFEIGFWLLDRNQASRVDEDTVTCPTLVIASRQDKITPASVVRSVADKYSSVATFREFKNHAHWVVGEPGWNEIAEYSSQWLDQVLMRMPMRPQPRATRKIRPTEKLKETAFEYKTRWLPAGQGDHRMHKRADVAMEVEANIPYSGNAQYYELGHTVNISQGGLYVDTDLPFEEGTYVNLSLNIGESERPVWVQGHVVRSSDKGMAMCFSHAEPERLNRLLPA